MFFWPCDKAYYSVESPFQSKVMSSIPILSNIEILIHGSL